MSLEVKETKEKLKEKAVKIKIVKEKIIRVVKKEEKIIRVKEIKRFNNLIYYWSYK